MAKSTSDRSTTPPRNPNSALTETHIVKAPKNTPVFQTIGYPTEVVVGRAEQWGGFAQLFNRVITSLAWSHLSDGARACYIVMVAWANPREQFKLSIGMAKLCHLSGKTESVARRGIKELLAKRLIELLETGGIDSDGQHVPNSYRLLIPRDGFVDDRPIYRKPVASSKGEATVQDSQWLPPTEATPFPGRQPPSLRAGQPPGCRAGQEEATAHGRQFISNTDSSKTAADAAALLVASGFAKRDAAQLASEHDYGEIYDAVVTVKHKGSKIKNKPGFIRKFLTDDSYHVPDGVKSWATIVEERVLAEASAEIARKRLPQEEEKPNEEVLPDVLIEAVISALSDVELERHRQQVLDETNEQLRPFLAKANPRSHPALRYYIVQLVQKGS